MFLYPVDYDFDNLAQNRCEYFIPISYQDLYDNLLIKKSINDFSKTDRFYIEEYKKILIKPSKLTFKIMAKDPNDKDSLKLFAEKYMSLFKLAIRESGTSIAQEQIVDGIDQLSAQRYKYNIIIDEENLWVSLKMHEVAHHVVEYLISEKKLSLRELNSIFANDY